MFKTEGYPNIRIKAEKLGFNVPKSVWILPMGFESLQDSNNILYSADYDTIIKLFRSNDIQCSSLDSIPKLKNNSFELFALPLIAFTYDYIKENPQVIIESLKLLADLFRKHSKPYSKSESPQVKVSIIKEERKGSFKKYSYQGPESSFEKFIDYVKSEEKNGE